MTQPSDILNSVADAWLAKIRAHFPQDSMRTIEFFGGDFGTDEVDRYGKAAPAAILTMDGGASESRGNTIYEVSRFDLFLLLGGAAKKRTRAALQVYEHVLRLVHFPGDFLDQDNQSLDVSTPRGVQAKNLFGEKLDELGLALWVCRWEQTLSIPGAIDPSSLNDFRLFHLTNTEAQDTSATDGGPVDEQTIELEQDT